MKLADDFKRFLDSKDIRYDYKYHDDGEGVHSFSGNQIIDNGPTLKFFVLIRDNGIVNIMVPNIVRIKETNRYLEGLKLVNKLSGEYLFVNFYLSDDMSIDGQMDINLRCAQEDMSTVIANNLCNMYEVIESAYPELIKLVWK
nr:MAG TPA: hypothetical protein [Caudoviricetes sp.]